MGGLSIRNLPTECYAGILGMLGADGGLAALFRLRASCRGLSQLLAPQGRALAVWEAVRPANFLRPVLSPASTVRSLTVLHEVYRIPRVDALAHEGVALLAASADGRLDLLQWLVRTFEVTSVELANLGAVYSSWHTFGELQDPSVAVPRLGKKAWKLRNRRIAEAVAKNSSIHTKQHLGITAEVLRLACVNGHFDTVCWLYDELATFLDHGGCTTASVAHAACSNGHLEIVKWLHARIVYFDWRYVFRESCRCGQLAIAQFLYKVSDGRFCKYDMCIALKGAQSKNKVAVVAWLKAVRSPLM